MYVCNLVHVHFALQDNNIACYALVQVQVAAFCQCWINSLGDRVALYHTHPAFLKALLAMPYGVFLTVKFWTLCIGAGLVTYSYAQSAESNDNDQPAAIQQAQYPKLNSLWERQVAADSTSMAYNLSNWTPQVKFCSPKLQAAICSAQLTDTTYILLPLSMYSQHCFS